MDPGSGNILTTLRRFFRRIRYDVHFRPLQQVESLSSHRFESTGSDPQLLLIRTRPLFPQSRTLVSILMSTSNPPASLKLYIDRGSGFSEADSARLVRQHSDRYIALIDFDSSIKALRLDPLEEPGQFSIDGLTFTETGTFWIELSALIGMFRWRRLSLRLVPCRQIQADTHGFVSTGSDPQFRVDCPAGVAPRGWVLLSLRGRGDGWALRPKLYVDDGLGFREDKVIRLPCCNAAKQTILTDLGSTAAALRLDPCEHDGTFEITDTSLTELGVVWARAYAAAWCLRAVITAPQRVLRLLATGLSQRRSVIRIYQSIHAVQSSLAARPGPQTRPIDALAALRERPLISVVMPVCDPEPRWLRSAIRSVQRQHYPHWELCIADDASTNPEILRILRTFSRRDSRVRVAFRATRGNIAVATQTAIDMSSGEFLALLDHDDELSPWALLRVAQELDRVPNTDIIYTDEDKIDAYGAHFDAFYKPDWSPEYLLSMDYISHLTVYRSNLVREVYGFRPGVDGAQDQDLLLRAARYARTIRHIPMVLYHWRAIPGSTAASLDAKPYAVAATQRVLDDYVAQNGMEASVEPGLRPGLFRVRHKIRHDPQVSIIIPSGLYVHPDSGLPFVERCIGSIRAQTKWKKYEILVVESGDLRLDQSYRLDHLCVRRIRLPEQDFNFSLSVNAGAAAAAGGQLLWLNDDTEIISPDWIDSMLEYSQMPEIGAVGARLYYPDGRIQHAGVISIGGQFVHPYQLSPGDESGYFNSVVVVRNYLAVTGACLMTKAALFHQMGGLDPRFPGDFNDVDFCLRLHQRGFRNVYTPYAELFHHETASRAREVHPSEAALFDELWSEKYASDPYYNINLSSSFPYREQ